jgi:hypothetical protein
MHRPINLLSNVPYVCANPAGFRFSLWSASGSGFGKNVEIGSSAMWTFYIPNNPFIDISCVFFHDMAICIRPSEVIFHKISPLSFLLQDKLNMTSNRIRIPNPAIFNLTEPDLYSGYKICKSRGIGIRILQGSSLCCCSDLFTGVAA